MSLIAYPEIYRKVKDILFEYEEPCKESFILENSKSSPLDQQLFYFLRKQFVLHNINTTLMPNNNRGLLYINICRKNKSKIIELANELIKKLEEEKYWKDNMPYYYVPDPTFVP